MNLQPEWITVGALAEGFAADNHILPSLDDLNGRSLTLHFANGWRIEHLFRLTLAALAGH